MEPMNPIEPIRPRMAYAERMASFQVFKLWSMVISWLSIWYSTEYPCAFNTKDYLEALAMTTPMDDVAASSLALLIATAPNEDELVDEHWLEEITFWKNQYIPTTGV